MTRSVDRPIEEGSLPNFYCPECTTLVYEGEPSCSACLIRRPSGGWEPLASSGDPYLGCVVDGRYFIVGREAYGGNSVVYRARSVPENDVVALKIARIGEPEAVEESTLREQMSREMRAVQMLENPHVVPIYEFLELDGGASAIVMEYVEGETAEQVVENEGSMEVDRALGTALQVAAGLSEAHRSDLIHRDIKPANVMLEAGGDERAFILDFGIVRLQAASGSTSGFIGTPLYASPEQIRMRKLDRRTDIYSLGATLYFFLTGDPPFEDEDSMAVMRAHLEASVPRVRKRRGAGVPRELERLVRRMLAKEPGDRPDDLTEVRERLESIRDATTGTIRRREGRGGAVDGDEAGSRETERENPSPRAESGERSSRSVEPALDHVSRIRGPEFTDAESSAEFTPVASETSEFGRPSVETGEIEVEESRDVNETLTGLQPTRSEQNSRRLSAEHSVGAWTGESESGEFDVLGVDRGEVFLVADGEGRLLCVDIGASGGSRVVADLDRSVRSGALGGSFAWVGSARGEVERIQMEEGLRTPAVSATGRASITALSASDGGAVVAAGTSAGELLFRRRDDGSAWERLIGDRAVEAVGLSEDGSHVVAARRGGLLQTVRPTEGTSEEVRAGRDGSIRGLAVASSGDVLGVFYEEGRVLVVHSATGEVVVEISETPADLRLGYFDADGNIRGVERAERRLAVWNLAAEELVEEVEPVSVRRRR